MWDMLLINPLINLLLVFYKYLGQEPIVAIALLTLLTRLALMPLTFSQQKSVRKQQELQPRLKELQEKYKDDKEALAREQMKLFNEAGINPMGGCLPLLIQFPLMIAVYQAIIKTLAASPLELLALPRHIYSNFFGVDLGLSQLIPLKSTFLWLDLALPDPLFILPILVVFTTWLQQKLLTPANPAADPQTQSMNQSMMITMPLMMGFITMNYASGLGVYFLIGNLVGMLQYALFRQHYQMPAATAPETTAKPAPREEKKERELRRKPVEKTRSRSK